MKNFRRFVKIFRKHFERELRSIEIINKDGKLNEGFGPLKGTAMAADMCAFAAREIATIRTGYVIADDDFLDLRNHAYEVSGLEVLKDVERST